MGKHFLVNPSVGFQDKSVINEVREEKENLYKTLFTQKRETDNKKLTEADSLKHIAGRVVVKIDIDSKDSWTFEDGTKIEYKRRFNNFNTRETNPVNAIVISGENIIAGAEILIHPNAIHDSNRIFNYKDSNDSIRYYSIHNDMCFAWHDGNEWQPIAPYEFALRIFKPYEGLIANIEPEQIKDVLWVTTGELKDKAVKTLIACDYQIVYQGKNGREQSLIRFRPFGDEEKKREEEAICILDYITEKVLSGKYLVGITISDAKQLNEWLKQ